MSLLLFALYFSLMLQAEFSNGSLIRRSLSQDSNHSNHLAKRVVNSTWGRIKGYLPGYYGNSAPRDSTPSEHLTKRDASSTWGRVRGYLPGIKNKMEAKENPPVVPEKEETAASNQQSSDEVFKSAEETLGLEDEVKEDEEPMPLVAAEGKPPIVEKPTPVAESKVKEEKDVRPKEARELIPEGTGVEIEKETNADILEMKQDVPKEAKELVPEGTDDVIKEKAAEQEAKGNDGIARETKKSENDQKEVVSESTPDVLEVKEPGLITEETAREQKPEDAAETEAIIPEQSTEPEASSDASERNLQIIPVTEIKKEESVPPVEKIKYEPKENEEKQETSSGGEDDAQILNSKETVPESDEPKSEQSPSEKVSEFELKGTMELTKEKESDAVPEIKNESELALVPEAIEEPKAGEGSAVTEESKATDEPKRAVELETTGELKAEVESEVLEEPKTTAEEANTAAEPMGSGVAEESKTEVEEPKITAAETEEPKATVEPEAITKPEGDVISEIMESESTVEVDKGKENSEGLVTDAEKNDQPSNDEAYKSAEENIGLESEASTKEVDKSLAIVAVPEKPLALMKTADSDIMENTANSDSPSEPEKSLEETPPQPITETLTSDDTSPTGNIPIEHDTSLSREMEKRNYQYPIDAKIDEITTGTVKKLLENYENLIKENAASKRLLESRRIESKSSNPVEVEGEKPENALTKESPSNSETSVVSQSAQPTTETAFAEKVASEIPYIIEPGAVKKLVRDYEEKIKPSSKDETNESDVTIKAAPIETSAEKVSVTPEIPPVSETPTVAELIPPIVDKAPTSTEKLDTMIHATMETSPKTYNKIEPGTVRKMVREYEEKIKPVPTSPIKQKSKVKDLADYFEAKIKEQNQKTIPTPSKRRQQKNSHLYGRSVEVPDLVSVSDRVQFFEDLIQRQEEESMSPRERYLRDRSLAGMAPPTPKSLRKTEAKTKSAETAPGDPITAEKAAETVQAPAVAEETTFKTEAPAVELQPTKLEPQQEPAETKPESEKSTVDTSQPSVSDLIKKFGGRRFKPRITTPESAEPAPKAGEEATTSESAEPAPKAAEEVTAPVPAVPEKKTSTEVSSSEKGRTEVPVDKVPKPSKWKNVIAKAKETAKVSPEEEIIPEPTKESITAPAPPSESEKKPVVAAKSATTNLASAANETPPPPSKTVETPPAAETGKVTSSPGIPTPPPPPPPPPPPFSPKVLKPVTEEPKTDSAIQAVIEREQKPVSQIIKEMNEEKIKRMPVKPTEQQKLTPRMSMGKRAASLETHQVPASQLIDKFQGGIDERARNRNLLARQLEEEEPKGASESDEPLDPEEVHRIREALEAEAKKAKEAAEEAEAAARAEASNAEARAEATAAAEEAERMKEAAEMAKAIEEAEKAAMANANTIAQAPYDDRLLLSLIQKLMEMIERNHLADEEWKREMKKLMTEQPGRKKRRWKRYFRSFKKMLAKFFLAYKPGPHPVFVHQRVAHYLPPPPPMYTVYTPPYPYKYPQPVYAAA